MNHQRIRSLVAICLLGFSIIGFAQSIPIMPSPLSIALTVGSWLIKDSRKVYYVQVESTAPNEEQARQAGFRLAVSQAVGTLVVSETEVKNKQLVRDEIIQYSSGYIDDFKIISSTQVGGMTRLVMDVWVVESKIADRILGESKADGTVDGARAALQQQTYLREQYTGDQLIDMVTRDFPKHAFDIKVVKSEVTLDGRDSTLNVRVRWGWSEPYIEALAEALDKTREGSSGISTVFPNQWPLVINYSTKSFFSMRFAGYKDKTKGNIIYNNIIARRPQIRLTLKDAMNQAMFSGCFEDIHFNGQYYGPGNGWFWYGVGQNGLPLGQFFSLGTPNANIGIFGNYEAVANLKVSFGRNAEALGRIKFTDVEIVASNECKK